jgi:uncharacterized membrane protein YcaP (DUF421 family)
MIEISWHDVLVPAVPVAEKVFRSLAVYAFLVVGIRIAGKRELAQLNPFDLIVLLTLSNTVQNAIIGPDNSVTGGIIGAITLLGVNHLLVMITHRSRKIEELVEGSPDFLIKDGETRNDRLVAEDISEEELEAAARKQGFGSIKDVDQAILYPGGTFCFIGKVPSTDAIHHQQIMAELHRIAREVSHLKPGPEPRPA